MPNESIDGAPSTIPMLALTGGPCSGKSSAMALLRQKLQSYGVTPLFVPEVATAIFSSGVAVGDMLRDPVTWRSFQAEIIRTQIALEERWRAFAALLPGDRKVLITDRGVMDGQAYIGEELFSSILYDLGLAVTDVRDRRYAAVFHLVTAARGAEAFYTLANNAVRTESPEEARALDERTLAAWTGHQHLRIFSNTMPGPDGTSRAVSFEQKMATLLMDVCRALELPVPSRQEHKFILAPDTDPATLPVRGVTADIEQTYLVSRHDQVERRVRRIQPLGANSAPGALYVYTEKTATPDGGRSRHERVLTSREYLALLAERDPHAAPIRKWRTSFSWNDQYYHIDRFLAPSPRVLLEVELTEASPVVALPPFVHAVADVSRDPCFRNAAIAREGALGVVA